MDSRPYDCKKLAVLLAATRDFMESPVTSITLQAEADEYLIRQSSGSVLTITASSGPGSARVWREDESPSRLATEPNKNS